MRKEHDYFEDYIKTTVSRILYFAKAGGMEREARDIQMVLGGENYADHVTLKQMEHYKTLMINELIAQSEPEAFEAIEVDYDEMIKRLMDS